VSTAVGPELHPEKIMELNEKVANDLVFRKGGKIKWKYLRA
jgi:hypothetical protein